MTHLRIEQNNGVIEEVSSSVITKLYEIAHAGLDVSSNLQGRLHVSKAYGDVIDWLTTNYPDLHITADGRYIRFADPLVDAKLATTWGDGIGTTIQDTQAITAIPGNFFRGTAITSFNELNDLTTITSVDWGGFYGCSNLTSIGLNNIRAVGFQSFFQCGLTGVINLPLIQTIGGTVWNQGSSFQGCTGITEVHCGSGLTRIGVSAFKDCTSLTTFSTTSTNFDIYDEAFSGCAALTSIALSTGTTSIPYGCFSGCSSLTSVTGLQNVTTTGQHSFSYCSALTTLAFGGNITEVGRDMCRNCSNLTTVTGLQNVQTIGIDAFNNCPSLQSVDIDWSKVTNHSIPSFCFCDCSSLEELDITGATTFEHACFYGCTNLTTITIPSSITISGSYCFGKCRNIDFPQTLTITRAQGSNSKETEVFANCDGLHEVILDQTFTNIWNGFFASSGITKITANYATRVNGFAFYNCTNLEEANFPLMEGISNAHDAVTWAIFNGCTNLKKVTLGKLQTFPNCTQYDYSRAWFGNCTSLEVVDIGDAVTNVNVSGDADHVEFRNCPSMKAFIIRNTTVPELYVNSGDPGVGPKIQQFGNTNTKIYVPYSAINDYKTADRWDSLASYIGPIFTDWTFGQYGFENCDYPGIMIEGTTTSIPLGCFQNSTNLKDVVFSDNITSIGIYAFRNCSNLLLESLPDSVTQLNQQCFEGCSNITINSSNNVTDMSSRVFKNCTSITSFTIKSKCAVDGASLFSGCTNLETVTFEPGDGPAISFNNESSWSDGAFVNTKITTLDFPERLSTLGNASLNCSTLRTLIIRKTTVPTRGTWSLNSNVQIYVPDASLQLYKDAWTDVSSRIHGISELPS